MMDTLEAESPPQSTLRPTEPWYFAQIRIKTKKGGETVLLKGKWKCQVEIYVYKQEFVCGRTEKMVFHWELRIISLPQLKKGPHYAINKIGTLMSNVTDVIKDSIESGKN